MTEQGAGDITVRMTVVASTDQVSSDLAGETVLLSMESAHYYGLNDVGSRVWELVQQPVRVSDICATIAKEYDVPADRCEKDVLGFLNDMAEKHLIEVRVGA